LKISLRFILIIAFCVATILLINKSDIFNLGSDIENYIKVVPLWLVGGTILFYAIIHFRKQSFSERTKLFYWTTICGLALVHFSIIKFDSQPFNGPIDSILQKDALNNSKVNDSLEMANEKKDSTIEYLYSIDTVEQGVYVWFDKRKLLLRKLTEEEKNGGEMRSDLDKEAMKKFKQTDLPSR
jgi:hypothetical protein